jgi:Domain of unknown function (DUF929)
MVMRGSVRALAVVVATIVVAGAGTAASYGATAGPGTDRVAAEATSVPPRVLDAVGAGAIARSLVGKKATLGPVTGRPLVRDGKPELLYLGADYCPYCAGEQWAMIVALSRFGRLAGLNESSSSATDLYPGTKTLRFYGAHYTSRFLWFTAVDLYSRTHAPLQHPTATERALMRRYDRLGGVPFLDVRNRFVQVGAIFSPQVLAGRTWWQIAVALHHPSSAVARSVDGAANYLTAAICAVTGNRPARACTAVIRRLERDLR